MAGYQPPTITPAEDGFTGLIEIAQEAENKRGRKTVTIICVTPKQARQLAADLLELLNGEESQ